MIAGAKKGDQIITNAGIYGTINKYFDDKEYFLLEIADKTVVKVQKNQIGSILRQKNTSSENEKEKDKKEVKDKKEDKDKS